MAGYNRNSPNPFVDGAVIEANDFDTEFGNLDIAFGTSGHNHNGTDGNGPKITTSGLADDAVTGAKIDSTTTVTAASFVGPLTGNVTGNLDANSATIDSLTITSGTAVTSIDTDLSAVSATDNTLASAKAIKTYVDAQVTASDLDFQGDSGGALSIDLDSETLTIAGGTGLSTTGSGNTLTVDIDSTVATLTGSQTLTNQTLTSTDINTPDIDGGAIDGAIIGGTTAAAGSFTTVSTTGNITVGGTVDGRDVATDGTKLDGIETGATADQTAAEIRSLVESATDSNVFTDTDHTKLDGIETGATADQTAAEIRTLVGSATDSNVFTDADHTKLDGIEASADVTDSTNVQSAGALMDSEVTNLAQVKAFSSADYATAAQGTTADSALQPNDNISELTNDSGYITGNQTITLSGDATGSGTTAITVALAANTVGVSELNLTDGTAGQFLKTDGAGTISFADAPAQGTTFTTLEVEPTDDHAIFSLQNTATNTFGNSKSYHEIRWDAKDLGGVDVTYAEIEGRTYATGERGQLNFLVKGASGIETYLALVGDDQRIEANKNIRFSNGNGIDFSATTDASGMTSELLDDYEEGQWSPVFFDGTTTLSATTNCTGRYTKVGQKVTIWANISNASTSGLVSGNNLRIKGLPFTPFSDSYGTSSNIVMAGGVFASGVTHLDEVQAYTVHNSSTDVIFLYDAGSNSQITVSDVTSGTNEIHFCLTYIAG